MDFRTVPEPTDDTTAVPAADPSWDLPPAHRELPLTSGEMLAHPADPSKDHVVRAYTQALDSMSSRCMAASDWQVDASFDLLEALVGEGAELVTSAYSCPDYKGSLRFSNALIKLDDSFVLLTADSGTQARSWMSRIVAPTPARLSQVVRLLHDQCSEHGYQAPAERAKITAWWTTSNGPTQQTDYIEAPTWDEAEANYPSDVRDAVEQLMSDLRERRTGVHVWTGPPGTGKTSAVRTIAQELAETTSIQVVIDPEQLLKGGVGYLMHILSRCKHSKRSYLLILEDAGQLLTTQAGQQHAEALGRILNVTDGMLGQNSAISVLITTNEDVGELHPALMRPGRCASQIEFREFTRDEARLWCQARDKDEKLLTQTHYTLAQLYALGQPSAPGQRKQRRRAPLGFSMDDHSSSDTSPALRIAAQAPSDSPQAQADQSGVGGPQLQQAFHEALAKRGWALPLVGTQFAEIMCDMGLLEASDESERND